MENRTMRHEPPKEPNSPPQSEKKPKRFRLVRLEERIAPAQGNQTIKAQTCACNFTMNSCFCCHRFSF
jgi:hypothetical protein